MIHRLLFVWLLLSSWNAFAGLPRLCSDSLHSAPIFSAPSSIEPLKENYPVLHQAAIINNPVHYLSDSKFDDTVPPYEGGIRRRYPRHKRLESPLSIFFLGLRSLSNFHADLDDIKYKLRKIGHPLGSSNSKDFDYFLDQLLQEATASARYDAISIIARRQEGSKFPNYLFKDEALRLKIYKKLWDRRMDPNLGFSDSVEFTLAGIAIESKDPVLLKFILWNDKFDLAKSGLLEHTIDHNAYESATIILNSIISEVTGEEVANVLTQATYSTSYGKTSYWLPGIFSHETWILAISKINPEELKHEYAIKRSGFSIPILQAAINQDHNVVRAILDSQFGFLKTVDDEYNPRFILNLVDLLSRRNSGSLIDQQTKYNLFLDLVRQKLKHTNLQIDTDSTGQNGPGILIDGQFLSVMDNKLEQMIPPISVREVLQFFCKEEIPSLPIKMEP